MTQNLIFQLLQETDIYARYDTEAKKLLSNKEILARIIKYSVEEFQNYSIPEIIDSIEGDPLISKLKVRPGHSPGNIVGRSNSDKEIDEGEITYDILFHVITPDNQRTKIIINVEAQNKYYPGYDLVTRGIFYCARILSSQLDTEFNGENYDAIKKVYSIWICKNVPNYAKHTITEYKITPHKIWGNFSGKVRYDLLSVITVHLGNSNNEENPLIRLLDTILSEELSITEKEDILENEFDIQRYFDEKGGLNTVCNLSVGILEKGIEQGKIITLYDLYKNKKLSLIDAAEEASMTTDEFLTAAKEYTN